MLFIDYLIIDYYIIIIIIMIIIIIVIIIIDNNTGVGIVWILWERGGHIELEPSDSIHVFLSLSTK